VSPTAWSCGGFDYTGADCRAWMQETGFRDSYVEPLIGAD
jgi:hypothetical protein